MENQQTQNTYQQSTYPQQSYPQQTYQQPTYQQPGYQQQPYQQPYPQPAYQQPYQPYPQPAPEAPQKGDEPQNAPAICKVFMFIATALILISYIINFANGTGSLTFLYFGLLMGACVLMILGLMMKKPLLFGIGMFLPAGYEMIGVIQTLVNGNKPSALGVLSIFIAAAFVLAGLYFVLNGKGINKVVKLIACIFGIVLESIYPYILIAYIFGRDILDDPAYFLRYMFGSLLHVFILQTGFVLMFVVALIYTPFRKAKEQQI